MVIALSLRTSADFRASIHHSQSSPPITLTVWSISSAVAGATVTVPTSRVDMLTVLLVNSSPIGLITERPGRVLYRSFRGCKAVDDKVDLAQVFFDHVDGLLLDFIRERVPHDAFCIQAVRQGVLFKSGCVVPARGGCPGAGGWSFKSAADGRRAVAVGSGDARCKSVPRGAADDQRFTRSRRCFFVRTLLT